MDSNFTIDLNLPPPNSPSGNIIIDLNEDDHEIGYPIVELDVQGFGENNVGAFLNSLDEEIVAQHTEVSYAMSNTNEEPQISPGNILARKRKILTNSERWAIYRALLEKSVDGKLKRNATKEVQVMFNIQNVRTVQKIWKIHKRTPPGTDVEVSSRKTKNCGRKRIAVDLSRIPEIELHKRTTLTSLSGALGVNYSKLYRLLKEGVIRRHSSAIKPHLKEANKSSRLQFCLSMLDESTILSNDPKFKGTYNHVHIDEKWFYMTKKDQRYYLLHNEGDPDRSCQNKNFISKVMFLVATARPRFDDEGRVVFDGKIRCWPFVTLQPAQRSSQNRPAGTLEMKVITPVKRDIVREFLIEKVIPAIHAKWPSEERETIYIQQDNARPHVLPRGNDFLVAASQRGFDIQLFNQPANSPDFNILDLGFFRAIQSLQQKMCARDLPGLVHAVEKAFDDYSPIKLNFVWLTLQLCMKESMKLYGGNRYKIPHMNKKRLRMLGCLPTQISCEATLVKSTIDFLATRRGGVAE